MSDFVMETKKMTKIDGEKTALRYVIMQVKPGGI